MSSVRSTSSEELRGLLAEGPDLDRDDWSLDDDGLALVAVAIAGGRETVIECGSGASTVVIARALRRRGSGTVGSLEHDAAYAARTRALLEAEGLDRWASVVDAGLATEPLAAGGCGWYNRGALTELPEKADLLLVDGPPAGPDSAAEQARYPALPVLAPRLAPGALVILDDAARPGERRVIERWRDELGTELHPVAPRLAAGVFGG